MLVAIGAAFISAAFFAASSAVQQKAAGSDTAEQENGLRLLMELAHERRWWLGLAMSAVAFALHAFALARGMLALVQPIIVSGLVFAVFVRAALEHRFPPRVTIAWCMVTWTGLAAFLVVVHSGPAHTPQQSHAAWFVGLGVVAVIGAVVVANRTQTDERRGLLFGAAAGVLFGLVAGLVKVVIAQAKPRWWNLVEHWPFWALILVGAGAVMLNQRAFQATRLSVSMPIVNIVNVMVAIAFGFAVFNERLFSSPLGVFVELLGLAAMALGVRQLADRDQRPETPNEPDPPKTATTPQHSN